MAQRMTDHKPIIQQAIDRLPHGEYRLALSDYPLSNACNIDYVKPDFVEQLASGYGVSESDNKEMENEYYEEISTIEKILIEEDYFASKNRKAFAINMWDWYGIPWRYENGYVHIIFSPQDVLGVPIIRSYPAEAFFVFQAQAEEIRFRDRVTDIKKLRIWRGVAQVLIIVLAIVAFGWLS